jgi:hypothetical protein
VLLADFENQTGDPRFDSARATAFTVSIEQSRYANVFPRMELDAVLKRMGRPQNERVTPTLGREICQRENVRALIASSITRTGQEYALTAQLIDPKTGDTVRAYTERSSGEDHILEALDVLSRDVREALGESLYQIQSDRQTASPGHHKIAQRLAAIRRRRTALASRKISGRHHVILRRRSPATPNSPWPMLRSAARTTAISTMLLKRAKRNTRGWGVIVNQVSSLAIAPLSAFDSHASAYLRPQPLCFEMHPQNAREKVSG